MAKSWRVLVDKSIRGHLEREVNESSKHKKAYKHSRDPSSAQLWCAIGNLSKQVFDVNLKLNYLESALRDIAVKKTASKKKVKKKRKK
jgi:hypothetical protein